ncbi:adaptin N terminal region-domain-containing protein [Paraphysoderma sedebokerense]|nr:adaptin N terminal region-domain-containing protein [Paraphysoderma sedebokerense]
MNFGKKDEDSAAPLHFDKSTILQETRVFNETPLNARKCRVLLAKVLALLYMGESFGNKEATEVFFATTKLFQSKDPALRQMIYLIIKELSGIADDVIMVTSSLTKDINAKPEELFSSQSGLAAAASQFGFKFGSGSSSSPGSSLGQQSGSGSIIGTSVSHRACAIRALSKITDPVMLQAIERFLKQAIVDKNASVSSAALVSSYHLYQTAKEVVKRWGNEVQEAVSSNKTASSGHGFYGGSNITQYHALGLLYLIRQNDRMAVAKLVQGLAKSGGVKSQWAQCMLIRFAVKCMEDESASFGGKNMVGVDGSLSQQMYDYLKSLCNNNEMVMLEAARALCGMAATSPESPGLNSQQLYPAVQALAQLLNSPRPALKFASLRTLNKLAMTNPALVSSCNLDMEQLITDSNRSIATFAITTLLKTGTESSVDRLMKQISTFMNEISDEFKIIVIDAIRALALKFPAKQSIMLGFLSGVLRDEGGYEYKKSIVEAIFDLVKTVPECKETALAHLCEFIEDCEFTKLAVRILQLIGIEGPKTPQPAKYIRYIYNRVILENSNVRAAAVTALAHFGCKIPDVRQNVKVLLRRCLDDIDDEVRDRATFYLRVLESETLMSKYLIDETMPSLSALEAKLVSYKSDPAAAETPFDVKVIPIITKQQEEAQRMQAKTLATQNAMSGAKSAKVEKASLPSSPAVASPTHTAPASAVDAQQMYATELAKIPEFAPIVNTLFKSSPRPIELTEQELEYVVSCVKHIFTNWVVFQFNCKNTVQDSLLENVTVVMQPESDDVYQMMQQQFIISAKRLIYNEVNRVYVAFKKVPGSVPLATFSTALKYIIKDCDPNTFEPDSEEGYDDEYQLEEVDLSIADYMIASAVPDFSRKWEELGQATEVIETFQLTAMTSLSSAVSKLLELLGMQPLEGTQNVPKDRNAHMLVMSGVFMPAVRVLVRVRMAFEASTGVTMEFAVRSENREVSELVATAIS